MPSRRPIKVLIVGKDRQDCLAAQAKLQLFSDECMFVTSHNIRNAVRLAPDKQIVLTDFYKYNPYWMDIVEARKDER